MLNNKCIFFQFSSHVVEELEESSNLISQSELQQITERQDMIIQNRKRAVDGLERQAKRMRLESGAKFSALSRGKTSQFQFLK